MSKVTHGVLQHFRDMELGTRWRCAAPRGLVGAGCLGCGQGSPGVLPSRASRCPGSPQGAQAPHGTLWRRDEQVRPPSCTWQDTEHPRRQPSSCFCDNPASSIHIRQQPRSRCGIACCPVCKMCSRKYDSAKRS